MNTEDNIYHFIQLGELSTCAHQKLQRIGRGIENLLQYLRDVEFV